MRKILHLLFIITRINFLKSIVIVFAKFLSEKTKTKKRSRPRYRNIIIIIDMFGFNDRRSIRRSISDLAVVIPSRLRHGAPSYSSRIEAARNFSPRQIRCYEGAGAY